MDKTSRFRNFENFFKKTTPEYILQSKIDFANKNGKQNEIKGEDDEDYK